MIIDLPRFIEAERPSWFELETMLEDFGNHAERSMTLEEARRFHFLYQKVSADLGRIATFASEPELRRYLESLIGRAYAEIHETRERGVRWHPLRWFFHEFPAAFRRHAWAFQLALTVTLVGAIFGGFAVALDEESKTALVPAQFAHLLEDPAAHVAREEAETGDHMSGKHAFFAASLMRNNISVSINAMAMGMTWGIGTLWILLTNGVLLGLVAVDFTAAGQGVFVLGWLLPHGSIELPAVIIGGQAGFVIGRALIGRGDRAPLAQRLRAVGRDVATLIGGVAVMLVWAGLVESYFSPHHKPSFYPVKIGFGCAELLALTWFLTRGWRRKEARA